MTLNCFQCLTQWQFRTIGIDAVEAAVAIYNGRSYCLPHLNEARGQPSDFGLATEGAADPSPPSGE